MPRSGFAIPAYMWHSYVLSYIIYSLMHALFSRLRQTTHLPLFNITSGFITVFCLLALFHLPLLSTLVDQGFIWSTRYFGTFWQFELLLTFLIALCICLLPGSKHTIGNYDKPEFTYWQWGTMITCTLLGGGGVFWAAGEPLSHFLFPPPITDVTAASAAMAPIALAQCFLHWGFIGWSILGSLSTIVLMHYHEEEQLPLAPRTLLYPLLGKYALSGPIAVLADASAIIAVVAGTVGPIGFLGLQVSYGVHYLFGYPDNFATQAIIICALVLLYTTSSISGLSKGIQILSRINVDLVILLCLFIVISGPTTFILKHFITGMQTYITHFFSLALYHDQPSWLGNWTWFFWGWFIGYGPLMAMFIARISRGRSIRAIICMVSLVAPLITNFWFAVLGGTGIALELQQPGSIATAFHGHDLPAALLAIASHLPFGFTLSIVFLVLTVIFVATTCDSMTYVIASSIAKETQAPTSLRIFWGIAMGLMALILLQAGEGGISKLQSFIIITAVPVSWLLIPPLWSAVYITYQKGMH